MLRKKISVPAKNFLEEVSQRREFIRERAQL